MNLQLIKKYLDSQKSKTVEKYDFEKTTVTYSSNIKQNREIKSISGDEEIVRAYILAKLTNELGYNAEDLEIEREYNVKIGRDSKKPRVDLIVKHKWKENEIFLFVELKAPDKYENDKEYIEWQLFGLAQAESKNSKIQYLAYYTTIEEDGILRDNCIIIDYTKYATYESWEKDGFPSFGDEIPAHYDQPKKKPYIKWGEKDLIKTIQRDELTSLKTNLHNVLWWGGGTTDSEIFYALVNIILAKIHDEYTTDEGEEYRFQIFTYGDKIEDGEVLLSRISELYKEALEKRLNITGNELDDMRLINRKKFPLNKLLYTVGELEKYSFTEGKDTIKNIDLLGEFFEGIIRDGFKQDKGQFFTPSNIIKFIFYWLQYDRLAVDLINTEKRLPYLIDPSSGSGTFLIESMKLLTHEIKTRKQSSLKKNTDTQLFLNNNFPSFKENHWAEEYIYGVEINPDLGTSIKVNMILHGDGNSNIFVQDGLSVFSDYQKLSGVNHLQGSDIDEAYNGNKVNGKFDIILSNPPFSVSLDTQTQRDIQKNFLFGEKKNSENLFIERYYQLLRPGGRMGIVLPESVFDTSENKYIRLFIYKYFNVKAVVSLPQLTFEPYTSTKTSVLFAQKKTSKEITAWNAAWEKHSKAYSILRTSIADYIKYFVKGEKLNKNWADYVVTEIESDDQDTIRKKILHFLKDYREEGDEKLEIKALLEKYTDEIEELSSTDKDLVGSLVTAYRENVWWTFGEVARELSYPIFMAEVEQVGYKRTKRGEKPAPNELYRTDDAGDIIVDDWVEETALDYLRKVEW